MAEWVRGAPAHVDGDKGEHESDHAPAPRLLIEKVAGESIPSGFSHRRLFLSNLVGLVHGEILRLIRSPRKIKLAHYRWSATRPVPGTGFEPVRPFGPSFRRRRRLPVPPAGPGNALPRCHTRTAMRARRVEGNPAPTWMEKRHQTSARRNVSTLARLSTPTSSLLRRPLRQIVAERSRLRHAMRASDWKRNARVRKPRFAHSNAGSNCVSPHVVDRPTRRLGTSDTHHGRYGIVTGRGAVDSTR